MIKHLCAKATYFVAFALAFLLFGNVLTTNTFAQADVMTDDMEWTWDADDSWDDWEDDSWGEWDYSYDVSGGDMSGTEAAMAFGAVALIWGIIMLPLYIYMSLSLMTIAKKLGISSAWFAWIPILNLILLCRCAGIRSWFFLLFFVPLANAILPIYCFMKMAERRGFESWVGILIIVPFIGIAIPGYLAWAEPTKKAT